MIDAQVPPALTPPTAPRPQLRVWHLALLVLFVAVAIAEIQDQRTRDPYLIALAAGGFVLYGVLGVVGWRYARRFDRRYKPVALFLLYATTMGALFVLATFIYVYIEVAYYSFR